MQDSYRPHEFVFEKQEVNGVLCVVVNYKHWSKDVDYWNKDPIVVFNYEPELKDLYPSLLNPAVVKPVSKCAAAPDFTDHSQLCNKTAGAKDVYGEQTPSKLKKCPRCRVQVAFAEGTRSGEMFTQAHQDAWGTRFAEMNQECANASMHPVKLLRKFNLQEPRLPYVMPSVLRGPSDAYMSVPPVTHEDYTEYMYQKLLLQAGVGKVAESVSSHAVHAVVGAEVQNDGQVSVAVVWAADTTDGGSWITLEDCNVLFDKGRGDSDEDEAEDQQQKSKQQVDAELEAEVQHHNWDEYFGRAVDDDLEIVVGFKYGRDTTCYSGVVLMPDFDDRSGTHRVFFPVNEANPMIGTSAQTAKDDYIDMRLDTLASTNEDTCFWVKQSCLELPFIRKQLTALKLVEQTQPKPPRKKKRRQTDFSDEDSERNQPKKPNRQKLKTKAKKPTNKEVTAAMLQRMRQTPL